MRKKGFDPNGLSSFVPSFSRNSANEYWEFSELSSASKFALLFIADEKCDFIRPRVSRAQKDGITKMLKNTILNINAAQTNKAVCIFPFFIIAKCSRYSLEPPYFQRQIKLVAKLKRSFSENQMFFFNGQCFTLENVNDICF